MDINGAFPSAYLKAADLEGASPIVTIDTVEMEKIGDDDKPVLYFIGKDKGMVLNRTNANTISDLLGTSETDQWHGKAIKLIKSRVDFQGKRVDAIRIDPAPGPAPAATPRRGRTRAPQAVQASAEPEAQDVGELMDDDIPFAWALPFVLPVAGLLGWVV